MYIQLDVNNAVIGIFNSPQPAIQDLQWYDQPAQPGDIWDGVSFVAPPPPQPVP